MNKKGVYVGDDTVMFKDTTNKNEIIMYNVINRLDLWPKPLQDVEFKLSESGDAVIVNLGNVLPQNEFEEDYLK